LAEIQIEQGPTEAATQSLELAKQRLTELLQQLPSDPDIAEQLDKTNELIRKIDSSDMNGTGTN
jgi:hypothetical protein